MNSSTQEAKHRFSIFKNQLLTNAQAETFHKIPYHFDFNQKTKYVFDHSNQQFNTIDTPSTRPRLSLKKNKIFDRSRYSSEQKSQLSSIEHSSRCNSFTQKGRTHSIFRKKERLSSEQDPPSLRDAKEADEAVTLTKTQSQTGKKELKLNNINKNQQQKMQFYREELERKLKQRQRERTAAINEIEQTQTEAPEHLEIMRPDQFARMLKEVRIAAKSKRNHIVYPMPKVLEEVPSNCFIRSTNKERLVYRI